MPELDVPPALNEVEVSIFGPGVGECVVVHTGAGEWLVVDSCLDGPTRSAEPVALRYLRQLKVDVATAVSLVVITHWHDDHDRGVTDVFRAAKSATVVMSSVLCTEEIWSLVRMVKDRDDFDSGVDEFTGIFGELTTRLPAGATFPVGVPRFAKAELPLPCKNAAVTALCPSDVAIAKGQVAVAERLESAVAKGRRLVAEDPNHTSVVLWIQAGSRRILLGSDLENETDPRNGWTAIVNDAAGKRNGAEVFKVAHHGSENGHHPQVWSDMLAPGATAALTPFRRSSLPFARDVERIKKLTPECYITAQKTAAKRPPKRGAAVDAVLNVVTNRRRAVRGSKPGHVRVRMGRDGGSITVDLFDGAKPL